MNDIDLLERELRRSLHGSADSYVPAPLPTDLWHRGRAPDTRTSRSWPLVAAAAVLVALLASLVLVTRPGLVLQPVDVPKGGALPTDAYLPWDLEGIRVEASVPEGAKASVVALIDEGSVALLVDAHTGEHHLVDLEAALGFALATRQGPSLALSPDGTRLAAAVIEESGAPGTERTGVTVLDLATTGATTEFLSAGDQPIEVRDLSWSADSETLAWLGNEFEPGVGQRPQDWVGTIVSDDTSQWRSPRKGSGISVAAVTGGGYVVGHERAWPFGAVEDDALVRLPEDFEGSAAADGTRLVLGASYGEPQTLTIDLTSPGGVPQTESWPPDAEGMGLQVAGLSPEGDVVALQPLAELTVRAMDRSGTVTTLTTLHGASDQNVPQVAVDLADTTPVDFAAPDWAPGPPWWVSAGLLLAAGLVVAVVVRWRRHPRPAGDTAEPLGVRRSRLVGPVVEAGVCLALASGLTVAVAPMLPHASGSDHPDGVLPTTLYAPAGAAASWGYGSARTNDFAVGRASMAQGTEYGLVVLVDATDGTHRLVSLPERNSIWHGDLTRDPVSLSPDGSQVAFVWMHLTKTTDQTTAGLAVLDLESGDVRKVSLRGRNDRPVALSHIAWAHDASHLMWAGDEAVQWDEGGSSFRGPWRRVGVTAVDDLVDRGVDMRTTHDAAIAVSPEGTGYALSSVEAGVKDLEPGSHLWTVTPGATGEERASSRKIADGAGAWNGAVLSSDGETMVVGTNNIEHADPYVAGLRTIDLTDPDSRMEVHPWEVSRSGTRTLPLGWTEDGALVVAHEGDREDLWVSLWDGEVTPITRVEEAGSSLTVATELADAWASFPEPNWPESDERRWTAALLGLALAFSLALSVRRFRRRLRARRERSAS